MIIFCKRCNYVGQALTVTPRKKTEQQCEVCPNCMVITFADYYTDIAAAHQALANYQRKTVNQPK